MFNLCRIRVTVLLLVSLFFVGSRANAWGESPSLKTRFLPSYLFYPIFKNHEINYCISIKDGQAGKFTYTSIQKQAEVALSLWLNVVSDITGPVRVKKVTCDDDNLNLEISVGPSKNEYWSYARAEFDGFDYLFHAYIRTNMQYSYNSAQLPIYDFRYLARKYAADRRMGFVEIMKFANENKMSADDFQNWSNAPSAEVIRSSYVALIHELGHAFGLCDPDYPHEYNCDPNYSSVDPSEQPPSVMKTASYFYLTPDDIAGVRAVFSRYSYLSRQN